MIPNVPVVNGTHESGVAAGIRQQFLAVNMSHVSIRTVENLIRKLNCRDFDRLLDYYLGHQEELERESVQIDRVDRLDPRAVEEVPSLQGLVQNMIANVFAVRLSPANMKRLMAASSSLNPEIYVQYYSDHQSVFSENNDVSDGAPDSAALPFPPLPPPPIRRGDLPYPDVATPGIQANYGPSYEQLAGGNLRGVNCLSADMQNLGFHDVDNSNSKEVPVGRAYREDMRPGDHVSLFTSTLRDMGYSDSRIERARGMYGENIAAAAEYLAVYHGDGEGDGGGRANGYAGDPFQLRPPPPPIAGIQREDLPFNLRQNDRAFETATTLSAMGFLVSQIVEALRRGVELNSALTYLEQLNHNTARGRNEEQVDPLVHCPICMDDVSVSITYALGCVESHRFCLTCIYQHISRALFGDDTTNPHLPACPQANGQGGCNYPIPREEMIQVKQRTSFPCGRVRL